VVIADTILIRRVIVVMMNFGKRWTLSTWKKPSNTWADNSVCC